MNKPQLINVVQEKMNEGIIDKNKMYSKEKVEKFIIDIFEVIEDTVASGEDVSIPGFGKFKKKAVKGREGTCRVGIRKGEPWKTEDSFKPFFDPSQLFYDRVNGGLK